MNTLVAFVVGVAAGAACWRVTAPVIRADVFARTNYREHVLPTSGGLIAVFALIAADAAWSAAAAAGLDAAGTGAGARHAVVAAAIAFTLLGVLDDLVGTGQSLGFRGHLRALATGQVTTGAVKLFGGGAVAVAFAAVVTTRRPGPVTLAWVLADAALVALAANLANLFDRAPGRTTKVALVCWVVLAAGAALSSELVGVALVVGATSALLAPDLREQVMLGDAGSNLVGAALGAGVVVGTGEATRLVVLVAVLGLNLASEKVSFSRVIAVTPPLRALDGLGRRRGD